LPQSCAGNGMSERPPTRDLTQGTVWKTLLLFALPTLGGNILQSLNQTISSIYLGQLLGENALAGATVAGMIFFLLFSTVFGLAMAATILIGQAMGRRDIIEVRRTIGAATGFFIIAGVVVAMLGWVLSHATLVLLATPKSALANADLYLRTSFLGLPFVFMAVLFQSALRGVGDAMTPLYSTILNVILSLILNPLFILGWGPIPQMGIAGAAMAGNVANIACLLFLIMRIYRKDLPLRLRGAEFALLKPDLRHLKPIMAIGLPMGLSMVIMSVSQLAMMGLINREGVDTVAAFGAANQLWSYVQMPAFAVGSAVSAMAAQNMGAGKWDRIDRIMVAGCSLNFGMTAVLVAIITVFAAPLLALFLPAGSAAIGIGEHVNRLVGWSFILFGVTMVVSSIVRANGAVLMPLLILIFGSVFVRLSVGFLGYPQYGAEAIWWSFSASSLVSAIFASLYYWRGGWRKFNRIKAVADPALEAMPPI
jgi:putative MATE family efflux protein